MQHKTMCHHGITFEDPTIVHSPAAALTRACKCSACHRTECREAKQWWKNQPIESAPTLIPGTTIHLVKNPGTGAMERYDAGPRGIEPDYRFYTMCLSCGVTLGSATSGGMLHKKSEHFTVGCGQKERRRGFKDRGAPTPWTMPKDPGFPTIEGWTIASLPADVDPDGLRCEIYHNGCGFNAKPLRQTIAEKCKLHEEGAHGRKPGGDDWGGNPPSTERP